MELLPTRLEGPLLIEPAVFPDDRGFFSETFRANVFEDFGITEKMVQHNQSRSVRGTLRGMHFQIGVGASKVVRCARGKIVDVLVDIRPGSSTYGQWEAFELDDEKLRTLYVPIGFAHGFCVLSDVADVVYRCSDYYDPQGDLSIAHDDPALGISWPPGEHTVSDRDRGAPLLADIADQLPFEWNP